MQTTRQDEKRERFMSRQQLLAALVAEAEADGESDEARILSQAKLDARKASEPRVEPGPWSRADADSMNNIHADGPGTRSE